MRSVYDAPANKIEVIPHGIPDVPFTEPGAAKARLGFSRKSVILTFGLLSPNKGIEVMIDAMPSILKRQPDAVYVVLGATHPNLVRHEGEAYRESLMARARARGVEDQVVFLNQFVDRTTLLDYISMCDLYVSPYLHEAQMTSGTLAYSFGLGKVVVSTPYWHALELLGDGHGVLVPFGDARVLGSQIANLLTDDVRRQAMRRRAYANSRSMTWERVAERYLDVFEQARRAHPSMQTALPAAGDMMPFEIAPAPQMQLEHLLSMCDDTGLFQHAIRSVPDRSHGYCVDDNARALLVACALNAPGEQRLPETLTSRLAAFVQHAWNPDTARFRNFMSFDRRWLEGRGFPRTATDARSGPWVNARAATSAGRADAGRPPCSPKRCAPRSTSAHRAPGRSPCSDSTRIARWWPTMRTRANSGAGWPRNCCACWHPSKPKTGYGFEEGLAYDNARLPQALIATGVAVDAPAYIAAGLRSLRWLMSIQTSKGGVFRPVGSASFGETRQPPRAFDQQPLEATAAISACLIAWRATRDPQWKTDAARAFAWFLGSNDLSTPLVDLETGSCRDGLHPERANENRGGESAVSYLLALAEIRQLERAELDRAQPVGAERLDAA